MHTTYRCGFLLEQKYSHDEIFDKVAQLCRQWLVAKRRLPLSETCLIQSDTFEECVEPNNTILRGQHADVDGTKAWALRLMHDDEHTKEIVWCTDVVVSGRRDDRVFFGCQLSVGSRRNSLVPVNRDPSRPGIVPLVLDEMGGGDGYPLLGRPVFLQCNDNDVRILLTGLASCRRTHPVVFASLECVTGRPMVDVKSVASHLAGLATVVVPSSLDAQARWTTAIPSALQVEDGMVAIYWPEFNLNQRRTQHSFYQKDVITRYLTRFHSAFALVLLSRIARTAIYRADRRHLTWEDIERMTRRHAVMQAKDAGERAAYADELWTDNNDLTRQLAQLNTLLSEADQEIVKLKARADGYRAKLEQERRDRGVVCAPTPETVNDVVEVVQQRHQRRLVFAFNNKSEHADSLFDEPEELLTALEWLATTYVDARSASRTCNNLDQCLRETVPGWSYSSHQSSQTTGQFPEWYTCQWEGRRYSICEHLRRGTGSDPRTTIRVAFSWDPERQCVVIGFIGQHQRNTLS